jgi:hypothetical protein
MTKEKRQEWDAVLNANPDGSRALGKSEGVRELMAAMGMPAARPIRKQGNARREK